MAVVANCVFVKGEAGTPAARAVQAGVHILLLSVFQRQCLKYEIPKSDRSAVTAEQINEDPHANSAEIKNGWRYSMGGGRAGYVQNTDTGGMSRRADCALSSPGPRHGRA